MVEKTEKENMNIVIVGHVDHGKSTLIGRLLYDTKSLPDGVYEEVKQVSEELGKDVEFAYLLDALEEEREQNVTIDTTQIFFKTKKRDYTIIDAPGHKEFLKNMITGASLAETAILIVDADEGVQEQTTRHAYILSMLGLKQVIVVMNKMDLVEYSEARYKKVSKDVTDFLQKLDVKPAYIIPISAMQGDNVANISTNMDWYKDITVLQALDEFKVLIVTESKQMRLPVQDVYKFDSKRITVGRVESGRINTGDEVHFLPSNKKTIIKSIEMWNVAERKTAEAGECIGITTKDPLFVERGEMMCTGDIPTPVDTIKASIFWMAKRPIKVNEPVQLKCATQKVECVIQEIERKIDSSTLNILETDKDQLKETEVGSVILKLKSPVVVEIGVPELSRFVLAEDDYILAGGIVKE
ncbi:MAG: GTP-binding protein [Nanoarchaeota archaeon]|nr:GTP-binding protein [Nanoarchaeota archaeon]